MPETSFGKYQLIELLGRGGMGEVWRAHDTVIDRTVAIKILPAEISKDEVFQERFRREAHAAARLNSPYIVPIHTHGEVNGRLFVDMRLIEGTNLAAMLDHGPLAPARAVRIIEQIAKALQAAHKIGLLHRDVKPSNILIDEDDDACLIDFGIAQTIGERGLTTLGDVIGTFHYMAPERFKPNEPDAPPVDARSDIYALACVLYECLTGRQPFPGDELEKQLANHLFSPPPRPSRTNHALGPAFDHIIAKGMAKDPRERYQTATELARAACAVITTPIPVTPEPAGQPTSRHSVNGPRDTEVLDGGRRSAPNAYPDPNVRPAPPVASREPAARRPVPPRPIGPPPPPAKPAAPRWRSKTLVVSVISATAVLAVVAVVLAFLIGFDTNNPRNPNSPQDTYTASHANTRQTALPFTGLRKPEGLTVDSTGTVYVADTLHDRIWVLAPRGNTATPLEINTALSGPTGVTTDNTGAVYINDAGHNRVLKLPNGQKTPIELPFAGLGHPTGLTVDSARTVYVTDTGHNRVVGLPENATTPAEQFQVPFTGLNAPTGLTMGQDGTLYVADGGNNRVLALPRGSKEAKQVNFKDLRDPGGVTVDSKGALYVTDSEGNRALELPAGSAEQIVLPFTGLDYPWGLAVDRDGTVYVAGHNDKILALTRT
ncbi:serine/threonine-protein kinase PknD [Mycobacterium conspicuum]|nr:serine/threonine-protein kinase PknD [Mycobacterium conspicuum]